MTINEVAKLVQDNGIEFFLCSFVEMSGAPKAKLVPATHLSYMAEDGAGFAGFAAGEMGQGPHSPDMAAVPDFRSLTVLPWRDNVAWVAGDVHVEGAHYGYCPRNILKSQIDKAHQAGYEFKIGVEPEFFLVKKNGVGYEPHDSLDTLGKPCYDLRALNRNLDLMTTLLKHMQKLGWKPYANDHEDANCQFEINWEFADALTTCDRHIFFRWMVRTMAEEQGLTATFMPKPFSHLTGNGCHFHLSLWDIESGRNSFYNADDPNGLSQSAYHFMGGLMKHARALSAIFAPTVNSYKRLTRGTPKSGATWAPVYISYGGSNRTQMIRIPGPGRIENRAIDGAVNPYLATACMLAAGFDGIYNQIDPGLKNEENLYEVSVAELQARGIEVLPANLNEAIDALEQNEVVKGALGEEYASYYMDVKRDEWRRYHSSVSGWEIENYLGVY
jgi:glutamine synthetase